MRPVPDLEGKIGNPGFRGISRHRRTAPRASDQRGAGAMSYIQPSLFGDGAAVWPFGDLLPQSYEFIMADPPWRFENFSEAGQEKGPEPHYRTMADEEILGLPVGDL